MDKVKIKRDKETQKLMREAYYSNKTVSTFYTYYDFTEEEIHAIDKLYQNIGKHFLTTK